jgi:hypothetical protein
MNKPYICNYHVPINRSWENSAAGLPDNPDDLDEFLRQAQTDADSLHEIIGRLDSELRTAKIDQEIARKKVEALTSLNNEISVLRRNEENAVTEKIVQPIRLQQELKDVERSQEPKRRSAPGRSKWWIVLAVVVILILIAAALMMLVNAGGPLGQLVETHVTDSLRILMKLRFF